MCDRYSRSNICILDNLRLVRIGSNSSKAGKSEIVNVIDTHDAGLVLRVFAPNDAGFIEVEPAYHSLSLFKIVTANKMSHHMINLLKQ